MLNFATFQQNNIVYYDTIKLSFHSNHAAKLWQQEHPFFAMDAEDVSIEGATIYIYDYPRSKVSHIIVSGWIYKAYALTVDTEGDYSGYKEIRR